MRVVALDSLPTNPCTADVATRTGNLKTEIFIWTHSQHHILGRNTGTTHGAMRSRCQFTAEVPEALAAIHARCYQLLIELWDVHAFAIATARHCLSDDGTTHWLRM